MKLWCSPQTKFMNVLNKKWLFTLLWRYYVSYTRTWNEDMISGSISREAKSCVLNPAPGLDCPPGLAPGIPPGNPPGMPPGNPPGIPPGNPPPMPAASFSAWALAALARASCALRARRILSRCWKEEQDQKREFSYEYIGGWFMPSMAKSCSEGEMTTKMIRYGIFVNISFKPAVTFDYFSKLNPVT